MNTEETKQNNAYSAVEVAAKLQQEVDFLLRNVDGKALDVELIEELVQVNNDGTISGVTIAEGFEVFPEQKTHTYADTLRPLKNDALQMRDAVTDKISQTFNKEKMNKGFAHVVGPMLYQIFRKIEY